MKVFLTGRWGRPMTIEQQIWRLEPRTIVRRWPNVDEYDVVLDQPRTPDLNSWDPAGGLNCDYFEDMVKAIDEFDPDLVICNFLVDSRPGMLFEKLHDRYKIMCQTHEAARLEDDRVYASQVCDEYGVDHAGSIMIPYKDAIDGCKVPTYSTGYVVKMLVGRGDESEWGFALFYETKDQLLDALQKRPEEYFPIVVEEWLKGIEIAFTAFVDYRRDLVIPVTTDFEYTKLATGDLGPETFEMGIHEVRGVGDRPKEQIFERLEPWFRKVKYLGWFDVSCMYNPDTGRLSVYEYMCRIGSGQMEAVSALLKAPFHRLVSDLIDKKLHDYYDIKFAANHALAVVVVNRGYPLPGVAPQNLPIRVVSGSKLSLKEYLVGVPSRTGLKQISRCESMFDSNGELLAKWDGKHLMAVGSGNTFDDAKKNVYEAAKEVTFQNAWYRTDIGFRWERPEIRCVLGEDGMLPTGWSRY